MLETTSTAPHLLVIPFPAQGHMLPLLDLCHLLSTRGGLAITIVVTHGNLPTLTPLLSVSPSISPLVLPFPSSPSLPTNAENTHNLAFSFFPHLFLALFQLLDPILLWARSHSNPPVAILSDVFTASWTLRLAEALSIPRLSFCSSGALALSVLHLLWRQMPPRDDPNRLIHFPTLPHSPSFRLRHLSSIFLAYAEGEPASESFKATFIDDARSWGFVLNTFSELETEYMENLKAEAGHRRVWSVGPLAAVAVERRSAVATEEVMTWLDRCPMESVVYVCFGSQTDLSTEQAAAVGSALVESGVRFLWCARERATLPAGLEEEAKGRGMVVKGWVPQLELLRHVAVGWYLTHCGWNSVLEAVLAGVSMLMWPMGADQFTNAMLMERAGVGVRVFEGLGTIPEVKEMTKVLAAMREGGEKEKRSRAAELRRAGKEAVQEGGSSFRNLEELCAEMRRLLSSRAN